MRPLIEHLPRSAPDDYNFYMSTEKTLKSGLLSKIAFRRISSDNSSVIKRGKTLKRSLIWSFLLVFILAADTAVAEKEKTEKQKKSPNAFSISVGCPECTEIKSIDLDRNSLAIVDVYLRTLVWTVDGYAISLIRQSDNIVVETVTTDGNGFARFKGVPPGGYTAVLRRGSGYKVPNHNIKIGDIVIKKQEDQE
jgi:hypothetical protein